MVQIVNDKFMEKNITHYSLFIKFGEKKWMKKLFEEGELFLNTVDYYTKVENKEIGDSWEDVVQVDQIKNFKLQINDQTLLTAPSGNVQIHIPDLRQNLYCLWSMSDEYVLENINKEDNSVIINTSNYNGFVDKGVACSVVITNLDEFIKKVERELKRNNLKYQMGRVSYYDENTYKGLVTPFMKRKKYELQNEFRILVDYPQNEPLIIQIGKMSDIASFFEDEMEFRQTFEINEEINI